MEVSVPATRAPMSVSKRLLLFAAAVALGVSGGTGWPVEASGWAYEGLLQLFVGPGFQIASLAVAVGAGFALGLVHVTAI